MRGAEGSYVEYLRPESRYHGWLLSTGNAFAAPLRGILRAYADGRSAHAAGMSRALGADIAAPFADAAAVPFGNVFSKANCGADHVLAYGTAGWRAVDPPATTGSRPLPVRLLEAAERIVSKHVRTR